MRLAVWGRVRVSPGLLLVVAVGGTALLLPRRAEALLQPEHEQITVAECLEVGLPAGFCLSAGRADYNTDAVEFEVPAAHSQRSETDTACEGADATLARLVRLTGDLREDLRQSHQDPTSAPQNLQDAASNLGRVLHTLQDECAHAGMPNSQHAYYTNEDTCDDQPTNPDTRPEAIVCAERVTATAMRIFEQGLADVGVSGTALAFALPTAPTRYPDPIDGCTFLRSDQFWDGEDKRWDDEIVLEGLVEAFADALLDRPAPSTLCPDGEASIANPSPAPDVDVSHLYDCEHNDAYCLAAHTVGDLPLRPPFYSVDGGTGLVGCQAAPGGALPAGWVLVLLGAWIGGRRRRAMGGRAAERTRS